MLKKIVGTSVDKQSEITALAAMDEHERQEIVDRAVAGEKVSAAKAQRTVGQSRSYLADLPPDEAERRRRAHETLDSRREGSTPSGVPQRINQPGFHGATGPGKPIGRDNQPRRTGRPPGSRNKMGSDLMSLVMQAAMETGFIRKDAETGEMIGTGEEGTLGYLKWAAIHKADRFIALLSRGMPQHVIADVTPRVLTRTEVEAQLKERGLPVGLLEHLRKAPVELDFDEDEDPYRTKAHSAEGG